MIATSPYGACGFVPDSWNTRDVARVRLRRILRGVLARDGDLLLAPDRSIAREYHTGAHHYQLNASFQHERAHVRRVFRISLKIGVDQFFLPSRPTNPFPVLTTT